MMKFAVTWPHPAAIRYPRGEAYDGLEEFRAPVEYGKSEVLYDEDSIALIAVGSMVRTAVGVRRRLKDLSYNCTLINARFVKPVDEQMLLQVFKDHHLVVTLEENVRSGGFGDKVMEFAQDTGADVRVINVTLPDDYIEHGNVDVLKKETGIDEESIFRRIVGEYIGHHYELEQV